MDDEVKALVKIKRSNLLPRTKNLKQSDWLKASKKLGLFVAPGGGKGSHRAVFATEEAGRTTDNLIITTQKNKLIPPIQIDYLKKLIAHGIETGNYGEDDVCKALKLLK